MKRLTATLAFILMFSAWADRYQAPTFNWGGKTPTKRAQPQPQEWDSNYKVQEKFEKERDLASEDNAKRYPSSEKEEEKKKKKKKQEKYPIAKPWQMEVKGKDN
jgi:hypothetical protein